MKADAARIESLERELGIVDAPKPLAEMAGYVVLMDAKDREASDRVRVTFTFGSPHYEGGMMKVDIKINEAPITLIPTRFGSVRAVAVFDDGSQMPACDPDLMQYIRRGWTFTITP